MPKQHRVREGEGLSSIAAQYGFFPDTIWNDPANNSLRSEREDPNILMPGDVLTIPDVRPKEETRPTGAVHRFQRLGVPAILRIQVRIDDELRAFQPYTLVIDGTHRRSGATDKDGVLEEFVPPGARLGVLKVGPDDHEFTLRIGHVRPVKSVEGVRTRLNNLGFLAGDPMAAGDEETRKAVLAFQGAAGLPENGDWQDGAFQAKLLSLHDTTEDLPPEPKSSGAAARQNGEEDPEYMPLASDDGAVDDNPQG